MKYGHVKFEEQIEDKIIFLAPCTDKEISKVENINDDTTPVMDGVTIKDLKKIERINNPYIDKIEE